MNNKLKNVLIVSGIFVVLILSLEAFYFFCGKLANPKASLHQIICCQCRGKIKYKIPYEQLGPDYLTQKEYKKHWIYANPKQPLCSRICRNETKYWSNLHSKILSIKDGPSNYFKPLLEQWHCDLLKTNEDLKERIELCKKIKGFEKEVKNIVTELKAKIDQRKKDIACLEKLKIKGDSDREECYQLDQKISELRKF